MFSSAHRTFIRRTQRIFLAFGAVVFALAAGELAAALTLGGAFRYGERVSRSWESSARFDPQYGWSCRPGARVHVRGEDLDYHVAINSAGFRDPERTLSKPAGTKRIVLLGDSMTWGWGVDQGQRFSDLLEQKLAPSTQLINLAVPGYGTDAHLWTLEERALAYQPDIILLCFVANDILEAKSSRVHEMFKPRFARSASGEWDIVDRPLADPRAFPLRAASWFRDVVEPRSALATWLLDRRAALAAAAALRPLVAIRPNAMQRLETELEDIVRPESVTFMLLTRLAAACKQHAVPLYVVSLPHCNDPYLYSPALQAPEVGGDGFETSLTARLRSAGASIGFPVFSIDAAFLRASRAGETLHTSDFHLNLRGNAVAAEALEPLLSELLR